MVNYKILEKQDLELDCLIAMDSEKGIYPGNHKAVGNLKDISPKDFRYHDHWGFEYIPISALGNSNAININVKDSKFQKKLALFLGEYTIDTMALLESPDFSKILANYEFISGDIHMLRFAGTYNGEDVQLSKLFMVHPKDGELKLENNALFLGEKQCEIGDEGNLEYAMRKFKGDVELTRVGDVSLHRKALQPYTSRGQYGSPHINGPWVILKKS